jgi:hypothetical protein
MPAYYGDRMTRLRCLLALLGVCDMLLVCAADPAAAGPADDAVAALQTGNLYVAGDIDELKVDRARAKVSLSASAMVKIAVLGSDAGNSTAAVAAFADQIRQKGTHDISHAAGSSNSVSSGGKGWAVLGGLAILGAGGLGALLWRRRRKDKQAIPDARADIQPYYDRLAADVGSLLQPGKDPAARQALADASERFNSTGSQLASPTSLAQIGGARRSVLEGLQSARTARAVLGIDLGPDLPPLVESKAPQLSKHQQIDVCGQRVAGHAAYTPDAPHFFAGGGGYAAGRYTMPFWETLLVAEALSPGWGSGSGWYGGADTGGDGGGDG